MGLLVYFIKLSNIHQYYIDRDLYSFINFNTCFFTLYGGVRFKGPSTLATLFSHMFPRIVAGILIPVGNHYFQALASTLQFVAQVCDRQWLVLATDSLFLWLRSAFAASTLAIVRVARGSHSEG